MAANDTARRGYLELRLDALQTLQAAAYRKGLTAHDQAADLAGSRACPKELARLRQVEHDALERYEQLGRAIRAIGAELEPASP